MKTIRLLPEWNASRRLAALPAALLLFSCVVQSRYAHPRFAPDGAAAQKRIALSLAGPAEMSAAAQWMYLGMLRDYLAHHSEYLILGGSPVSEAANVSVAAGNPPTLCRQRFGGRSADAVLSSKIEQLQIADDEVQLAVVSTLLSCTDGEPLWRISGASTWAAVDSGLRGATHAYGERYGEPRLVPAYWRMIRALYDELPGPRLSPAEADEKIELDSGAMFRLTH
ncbi:MAG: MXAN_6521/LA_1396 family lipoprotein [Leptospirales bacterium]|nr:MXAN_6521/LA_1396 family lipoprotein [Leptospirales bacterium]